MQVQTQYSVFLVNKPGVLAAITTALAKAKVSIIALTLMDSMEHGVLRMVCTDPEGARKVFGKAHDRWTETDVLVIDLPNRVGAFAKIADTLATEHVNISYAYCTGGAGHGCVTGVFKVADLKKAQRVLKRLLDSPARTSRAKASAPKTRRTVKKRSGKRSK